MNTGTCILYESVTWHLNGVILLTSSESMTAVKL